MGCYKARYQTQRIAEGRQSTANIDIYFAA